MKALIIIRVYTLDDWRAYNCYQTFLKVLPDADYIFFAQSSEDPPKGGYKWITSCVGAKIVIRPYCCNFGGRDHVRACVQGLKTINTNGYDKVIFSDADIVVNKNPLDEEFYFGGVKSSYNDWHYSGQMLIFDRELFDMVVNYKHYEELFNDFILLGDRGIADDTIFSTIALKYTNYTKDFLGKGYWEHVKLDE